MIYRFGVFELDTAARELRKRGLRLRLQDQPFRVLTALLESPSRIVTREDLQAQLWPDDTFVDFNHGLNSAVNRIRQALGDSASNPRFIETVPKVGYRFIAPLLPAQTPVVAPPPEPPPPSPPLHSQPQQPQPAVAAAAPNTIPDSAIPGSGSAGPQLLTRLLAVAVPSALALAFLGYVGVRLMSSVFSEPAAPAPIPGPWAVRILAGSSSGASDAQGVPWSADAYYSGGSVTSRRVPVRASASSEFGLAEPILYRGERYGNFRYAVPAPPGEYRVRLYFAETWFGPGNDGGGGAGSRAFQVLLNGKIWLDRFDILVEAGGANREIVAEKRVVLPADAGRIVLDFVSQTQNAAVNAIEITPAGDR